MKKKSYTLIYTLDKDGEGHMSAKAEGLTPFEIIGLLAYKTNDIYNQLAGAVKPPEMVRSYIVTDPMEVEE